MGGGGGLRRERATQENFENMDCKIRHLQCISGILTSQRGLGGGGGCDPTLGSTPV